MRFSFGWTETQHSVHRIDFASRLTSIFLQLPPYYQPISSIHKEIVTLNTSPHLNSFSLRNGRIIPTDLKFRISLQSIAWVVGFPIIPAISDEMPAIIGDSMGGICACVCVCVCLFLYDEAKRNDVLLFVLDFQWGYIFIAFLWALLPSVYLS